MLLKIVFIAALVYQTWLAWVAQPQYEASMEHSIASCDLARTVLRASILVWLLPTLMHSWPKETWS